MINLFIIALRGSAAERNESNSDGDGSDGDTYAPPLGSTSTSSTTFSTPVQTSTSGTPEETMFQMPTLPDPESRRRRHKANQRNDSAASDTDNSVYSGPQTIAEGLAQLGECLQAGKH